MYKVDTPVDKSVERRRSAEAKRKARIFNTRQRVMGIDLDALNQQVQEKTHQQNMEMQLNKACGKKIKKKRLKTMKSLSTLMSSEVYFLPPQCR